MLGAQPITQTRMRARGAGVILATIAALGGAASLAAPGLATSTIEVGAGETSIVVDGTTISTSNLTIAQLAKLQGVPPSTVQLELDGVAASTPEAAIVEALIARLPLQTTLDSALNQLSGATGGLISPQTALRQVVEDEGVPGRAGVGGANGTGGSSGAPGASGAGTAPGTSATGSTPAKKRLTLRAASGSLRGHPGSRLRVRFTLSAAAKLSYSGRKLAKGSRAVKPGASVLMVKLPRKHGTYQLVLKAVGTDGQRAQTTVTLHDAISKRRH
jgi:hypothetical protein